MYLNLHGEVHGNTTVDGLIREYFPDLAYRGTFLDIGAYEPINISNSYHFEMNGWEVWCVEANPERIPLLKEVRKNVLNYAVCETSSGEVDFHVVTGWGGGSNTAGLSSLELDPAMYEHFKDGIQGHRVVKTPTTTLAEIFEVTIKRNEIDVMSIDVEGSELRVLKGMDFRRFGAKLIVIENFFGSKELGDFLVTNGYSLHRRVSYNEFYVQSRLVS